MSDIGYVFYIYLVDFIKMWLVFWGIICFTPTKKSFYIGAGIVQSIILVIAGIYYQSNTGNVLMLLAALVIFAVCFLFQGNFFKKLAYALLAYIFVLFLDGSMVGIFSALSNKSSNEIFDILITRIICNVLNIMTLGIVVYFIRRRNKVVTQKIISKRIYTLLFAGVGTGILILLGVMISADNASQNRLRKIMMIVTIIIIISYSVACFMMIVITESRDNFKALSLINQSIIESQQQYYMLVNEKQQEMRGIRHEMKNHLACINGLYKANKLHDMELYVNQLVEESDISEELFDTGNDIVNAILNDAQSRYRKDHILIRLQGGFPVKLKVAPMDLCVIVANVITNAVEAIQKIEREENDICYIDVKISSFKDDLFIDVKNPIDKNVVIQNGNLITTKKDKSIHGFGTKNIRQRVERYQGTVNYRNENNLFFVEICMKNNP